MLNDTTFSHWAYLWSVSFLRNNNDCFLKLQYPSDRYTEDVAKSFDDKKRLFKQHWRVSLWKQTRQTDGQTETPLSVTSEAPAQRPSHNTRVDDRSVWSSDGIIISRETTAESETDRLQCHFMHYESHMKSTGTAPEAPPCQAAWAMVRPQPYKGLNRYISIICMSVCYAISGFIINITNVTVLTPLMRSGSSYNASKLDAGYFHISSYKT
jgi:hypothetical protein